jgi:hypothetical protein
MGTQWRRGVEKTEENGGFGGKQSDVEENRVGLGIDFLALPVSKAGHLWLLHSNNT